MRLPVRQQATLLDDLIASSPFAAVLDSLFSEHCSSPGSAYGRSSGSGLLRPASMSVVTRPIILSALAAAVTAADTSQRILCIDDDDDDDIVR